MNNCLISLHHTANQTFHSVFSNFQVTSEKSIKKRGSDTMNFLIHSFIQKSLIQATNANNTVNTFENTDTKFHNNQRKTIGDVYIYFIGDLLMLNCSELACLFSERAILTPF